MRERKRKLFCKHLFLSYTRVTGMIEDRETEIAKEMNAQNTCNTCRHIGSAIFRIVSRYSKYSLFCLWWLNIQYSVSVSVGVSLTPWYRFFYERFYFGLV